MISTTVHAAIRTNIAPDIYKTVLLIVTDLEGSSLRVNVVVDWFLRLPSLLHIRAKSFCVNEWVWQASLEETPVSISVNITQVADSGSLVVHPPLYNITPFEGLYYRISSWLAT
jgi:hypothetical protein